MRCSFKYIYMCGFHFMIAIICMIQAGIIFDNWEESYRPPDYLSKDYREITIGYDQDLIEKDKLDTSDLLDYVSGQYSSYSIQKNTDYGYSWICYDGYRPYIELLWGREFCDSDFNENKDVALISEKLEKQVTQREQKKYILIDQMEFEVIGVYAYEKRSVTPNANAYLSMQSDNYTSNKNYIEGKYYVDAAENMEELVQKLDEFCKVVESKRILDYGVHDRIAVVLQCQLVPVQIVGIILGVVLLGLICISTLWMNDRKKEIYVRSICGARSVDIWMMIIKEYAMIIVVCNIIAGIIMMKWFVGIEVVVATFLFSLIIGVSCCMLFLLPYRNMRIIEMKVK